MQIGDHKSRIISKAHVDAATTAADQTPSVPALISSSDDTSSLESDNSRLKRNEVLQNRGQIS